MSITSDIRSYADTALGQGKQVLDQAQTQLNGVTEQANELVVKVRSTAKENVTELTSKATDTVTDVRAQVEKAVNLEAIKAAIEPYLAQAKGYSTTVTDRAEDLYSSVKSDKRVAAIVTKAEEFTGVVVETVQERVVKPVRSLTARGTKVAPKRASKPAVTKPAAAKPAAKVTKPAARKAPAKKASAKA